MNIKKIILEIIPILILISLIPIMKNDYYILISYIILIAIFLKIKYEKNEYKVLIGGIILMTIMESLFILTGVETFKNKRLLGIMPIWLPIIWGYGMVAMRRVANELIK